MSRKKKKGGELQRTLGLPAAMSIGIGTMVGAGIFVFPGLAAGQAGPAAMLSFLLAGLVALLVAFSTAELATAMPESGGGYYFVSRTFGPLWGMLVGIGQWLGLVFASAFYLVGFGEYVVHLLEKAGLSPGSPVVLIALGAALLLTLVNLLGTRGAGKLQNRIVVFLTALLSFLFLYGILNALGLVGEAKGIGTFAPRGIFPIFTTSALIFTSYLGFVQIATVAGEIKQPQRNLPRALIGSVLVVTVLYLLALFVSNTVLPVTRLKALGETAMVEVGRRLIGPGGAVLILAAGLLATLSSANASILSSSRAVYALGRDGMLPQLISRVNRRFGTPHVALLLVGVPIAGLTLLGRIEVLAEVASLLHLILYGLICLAHLQLRRRHPIWYAPTFRAWGYPLLPALGALATFSLIALMQALSIGIGLGILAASLLWYFIYGKGKSPAPPQPPHIIPDLREPSILLPVEMPEPASPPDELLKAFRELKLHVLGFRLLPEQTSAQQAEEEAGKEDKEALGAMVENLQARGMEVEHQLVFTEKLSQTLAEYIQDSQCQAILIAKPISRLRRILVPLYAQGQVNTRLATMLRDLSGAGHIPIALLLMPGEDKISVDRLQQLAVARLRRSGIPESAVRPHRSEVEDLSEAIGRLAGEEDLVVLSESEVEERARLFSSLHGEIYQAVEAPLLVVLGEREESEK